MVGIYKIVNKINGKVYIGKSICIKERWGEHLKKGETLEDNSCIYQAMRKHGIENFSFEVIEECPKESLNEREIYWIKEYQSFPPNLGKGYNMTPGGDGNCFKLSENQFLEILNLLKENDLSMTEIGLLYGVTESTISCINRGVSYFRKDLKYPIREAIGYIKKHYPQYKKPHYCLKCGSLLKSKTSKICPDCRFKSITKPKPSYEDLLKDIYELGTCSTIGKKYNASSSLVGQWCTSYGIDVRKKNECHQKYEVEFLCKEPKKKKPKPEYLILMLDPITKKEIKTFKYKTDICSYFGLGRNSIGGINDALKNKSLYKGYLWELI